MSSHKHLDRTAGSEYSDYSPTHICNPRCQTKVFSFGNTPSYIQVGMFRSPRTFSDLTPYIDLLNSISLLLLCNDPAAGDLLPLIGECCSAKEVVIAIQEAVERLEVSLNADNDGFEEVEQKVPQQAASSPVVRLSILTGLYAASIPRLKLRKKTAPDTLRPLLTELETVNLMAGSTASTEKGRALISAMASLVKRAAQWVKGILDAKEEDALGFTDAYTFLGCTFKELTSAPTTVALVVIAYHQTGFPDSNNNLAPTLPILISSIQINSALDECLSILLKFLQCIRASSVSPPPTFSPEIVTPLSFTLVQTQPSLLPPPPTSTPTTTIVPAPRKRAPATHPRHVTTVTCGHHRPQTSSTANNNHVNNNAATPRQQANEPRRGRGDENGPRGTTTSTHDHHDHAHGPRHAPRRQRTATSTDANANNDTNTQTDAHVNAPPPRRQTMTTPADAHVNAPPPRRRTMTTPTDTHINARRRPPPMGNQGATSLSATWQPNDERRRRCRRSRRRSSFTQRYSDQSMWGRDSSGFHWIPVPFLWIPPESGPIPPESAGMTGVRQE
ncbi:uncharacterized protein LACBIDRAFT_332712 [Laccaria bicolor S238N-H82]|uniref:Predicted protein n=1 Tax=Laccaria bicolor (strain S238N-H82 / ATCC MYA-4686) TaxID=486041 RepID=B0DTN2_LACBS|nr:uncharacterized protein LACBIDRAFT_332712 [Laccaria bicolor S238N-H82]EDR02088.1 predicted protein [Laccaria bicolor S238N-H82]|eukprot:XP_001887245.1 predicted protein [Laccaria bicolor S238N-H82]